MIVEGFTIEVFDKDGVLVEGISYPDSLAKLHHERGTCTFNCSYCYEEAIKWMLENDK
jgi:hypothetical protein